MNTIAYFSPATWALPIRQKLFIMVGFLIAIISVFIYVYFPSHLESQARDHLIDKASSIAEVTAFSVSPGLYFEDVVEVAAVFEGAAQNQELIYLGVFDGEGNEFQSLEAGLSAVGEEDIYRTETPVVHMGRQIGRLEVAFSMVELHDQVSESRKVVALLSLLILLAGSAWAYMISTVVTRPLAHITVAAAQIEKGDLSPRAAVLARDEVGKVATAFNTMVSRIAERTAERGRAELALRESEQRFRALIEQAADAMFVVRRDGSFSEVNDEACESLGYNRQELVALSVFDVDMRFLKEDLDELWQTLEPGTSMTIEGLHRRNDGSTFPVEVRVGFIELQGEKQTLALVRDVSTRVVAEEARETAEAELEKQRTQSMRGDRLRSLGEMAAGIAHELNQPLVGVRGLAEHTLIGMDKGWNIGLEQIRERMSLIVEQADRMTHIIEHVRMFAREAGGAKVEEVRLNDVVESAVGMLDAQLRAHGLAIELALADDLPLVVANPFSVEEVLLNLINNARDALAEEDGNGSGQTPGIWLRTRRADAGGEPGVAIDVEDNGAGISDEVLGRIFDPFFTTKDPDKGTGLGLSVSRAIVEEFGGQLQIRSALGHGCTATISLPALTGTPE